MPALSGLGLSAPELGAVLHGHHERPQRLDRCGAGSGLHFGRPTPRPWQYLQRLQDRQGWRGSTYRDDQTGEGQALGDALLALGFW